jgi:hypothetical protein
MAQSRSENVRALINRLRDDWTALYGKYPDQALFALGDDRVADAIERQFEEKARLSNIKALPYNFETGLNSIIFEFTSSGTLNEPHSFMIMMDGNCRVVAIIDPFDPIRPNAFAPQSSALGERPFVLARPSATENVAFNDAEFLSLRMRSREYFMRLPGGGGDVEIYTTCTYYTQTNLGRDHYNDRTNDDCGLPGPIIA